jgi:glycosyltransferase involved in cell wall biosynthesis
MNFTFGIITVSNENNFIDSIIDSIERQNIPNYEIIVVGDFKTNRNFTRVIKFDETIKKNWITRKKNIITNEAKYDNIVYLHDYIKFNDNWYKGQLISGDNFQVRVDRTLNLDGTRAGDWLLCMWGDNVVANIVGSTLSCLLPYSIKNLSRHMYISCAYYIAKKNVMEEFPWDESLSWGESDDVEWSKRVRNKYNFEINTNSIVQFMKQKDMPFTEPTGKILDEIQTLNDVYKSAIKNKFKIVVPSYNNEKFIEFNLASILNQTYTNYDVLYINDASTDNTYESVKNIVGNLPNWKIINNTTNMGACYNYTQYLNNFIDSPNDILVHLDGDDWFYDDTVLEKLNNFYNKKDCWMTYGGFLCYNSNNEATIPYPQSTPYPKFIHNNKFYRQDVWRASHLRTFRAFLFNKINQNDFISKIDNKYYWHASDLAWQYPCLEMCGEDKIGVVDFYTHVYNQTNENRIRTAEREDRSNQKYEIEIRNKKKYETGLSGKTLPQVNVFNADYYFEYNNIPKKFSYCYQQNDGEYDMVVLCDPAILDYLEGKIKINKKVPIVARLFEQREYFNRKLYNAIISNYNKFDKILTFDRELLKLIPNAIFLPPTEITQFNRLPNPNGHPPYKSPLFEDFELPKSVFQIYPKNKLVSAVVSNKAFLPGHVKRLNFIKSVQNKIDLFGRGIRELPSKIDGLRDYMFSIAIENVSCDDNYFSEKIIDCFITGTIPIYHGCIHIHEFFDVRGILVFETEDELHEIIDSLSEEKYYSMLEYAKINFNKCFEWPLDNDMLYDMYYKKIIENGTSI